MTLNYYDVLKLPTNASQQDITNAYKRLTLKCLLPQNPMLTFHSREAKFNRVSEAYQILINPKWRSAYDEALQRYANQAAAASSRGGHFQGQVAVEETTSPVRNAQQETAMQGIEWDINSDELSPGETDRPANKTYETALGRNVLIEDYGSKWRLRSHPPNLLSLLPARKVFEDILMASGQASQLHGEEQGNGQQASSGTKEDERAYIEQLLQHYMRYRPKSIINIDVFGNRTEIHVKKNGRHRETLTVTRNGSVVETVDVFHEIDVDSQEDVMDAPLEYEEDSVAGASRKLSKKRKRRKQRKIKKPALWKRIVGRLSKTMKQDDNNDAGGVYGATSDSQGYYESQNVGGHTDE